MQRRPRVLSLAAALLVASPLLLLMAIQHGPPTELPNQPARFTSYWELRSFITQRMALGGPHYMPQRLLDASPPALAEAGPHRFSQTNVQVEGVDEPDLIKTDGRYIYVSKRDRVYILKAHPPQELGVVTLLGVRGWGALLFASAERLVVIAEGGKPGSTWAPAVSIGVYNISDRSSPRLLTEITLEGFHLNSRLIGEHLYVIVQQPAAKVGATGSIHVTTPSYYQDRREATIEASNIYYSPKSLDASLYTIIVNLNIVDGQLRHQVILTGQGSVVYATQKNIYVAIPELEEAHPLGGPSWGILPPLPRPLMTSIYRVAIDGGRLAVEAKNTVPGSLLNQFSMDEHDGFLRVATTALHWKPEGGFEQSNNIYVLDNGLRVVGSLEGLAPHEQIYSVRFLGNRAYLVTFKKVDPLFSISLEDPRRPVVLGYLKMPGFSQYLHPIGDGYLLGLGKEAVEASEGDFAWFQGLKLTLFRVGQDGAPEEVANHHLGDRGTESPALQDHRAFLYDPETGLVVIPVLLAQRPEGDLPPWLPGAFTWQGAYIFKVSPTEGIRLLGRVTHLDPDSPPELSPELHIKRALLIDSHLYTLSEGAVMVHALPSLQPVAGARLP